jgi:hypothetical protein
MKSNVGDSREINKLKEELNSQHEENNYFDHVDPHHPNTCFICVDNYSMDKKPLILVCGHTFCEVCLQNMFDNSNEIQCCFCKVITKLDKFDDMIVNYAVLSLATSDVQKSKPIIKEEKIKSSYAVNTLSICNCFDLKKNPEKVDKLLQCIDCNRIVCSNCISPEGEGSVTLAQSVHRNHKITNLVDYISSQSDDLSGHLKTYRDLANKLTLLNKKVDKFEIEKIIKAEKENVNSFFKNMKSILEKNQEIMIHSLDKLLKDSFKAIDSFKKDLKYFNSDSTRYCTIVEELCNFKSMPNKQKVKLLNIYNINSTLEEIKEFNKEVNNKVSRLLTPENFMKKYVNLVKCCEVYKNKMWGFHNLVNKKGMELIEKGFEKKINFYVRKHK